MSEYPNKKIAANSDVILVYEDDKENCYAATAIADINPAYED